MFFWANRGFRLFWLCPPRCTTNSPWRLGLDDKNWRLFCLLLFLYLLYFTFFSFVPFFLVVFFRFSFLSVVLFAILSATGRGANAERSVYGKPLGKAFPLPPCLLFAHPPPCLALEKIGSEIPPQRVCYLCALCCIFNRDRIGTRHVLM